MGKFFDADTSVINKVDLKNLKYPLVCDFIINWEKMYK